MKTHAWTAVALTCACLLQDVSCEDDHLEQELDLVSLQPEMSMETLRTLVARVQVKLRNERDLHSKAEIHAKDLGDRLTNVTADLSRKEKALRLKDLELWKRDNELSELKTKLQASERKSAKFHATEAENAELLKMRRTLEGNLSSTVEALRHVQGDVASLHDSQLGSVSHCGEMMSDVNRILDEEKKLRAKAQSDASDLEVKLAHATQEHAQSASALQNATETLRMQAGRNANLTILLQRQNSATSDVKSRLRQSEGVRLEKTEQLRKLTTDFKSVSQQLSQVTKRLQENKRMADIGQSKLRADMMKQETQARQEAQRRETTWLGQKQMATQLINSLKAQVSNFTMADTRLKQALAVAQKSMNQAELRAETAERTLRVEHQAMITAQQSAAAKEKELEVAKASLRNAKTEVERVTQFAKKQFYNSSILSNAHQQAAAKLQQEEKALEQVQKALHLAQANLLAQSQAHARSDKRVRQLWLAVRQKQDQLRVHDEEAANVRRHLDLIVHTANQTISTLLFTQEARDRDLIAMRSKLLKAETAEKEFINKLANRDKLDVQLSEAKKELVVDDAQLHRMNTESTGLRQEVVMAKHQIRDLWEKLKAQTKHLFLKATTPAGNNSLNASSLDSDHEAAALRNKLSAAEAELNALNGTLRGQQKEEVALVKTLHGSIEEKDRNLTVALAKVRSLESSEVSQSQAYADVRHQLQTAEAKVKSDQSEIGKLSAALIKVYNAAHHIVKRRQPTAKPAAFLQAGLTAKPVPGAFLQARLTAKADEEEWEELNRR